MPSSYTPNYQLSQWEPGDQVLREDFNADNAKIDAALAGKVGIIIGTYTGTDTYGPDHPNIIEIPDAERPPQFIYVAEEWGFRHLFLVRGCAEARVIAESTSYLVHVTWTDKGVEWYSEEGGLQQLNYSRVNKNLYRYAVFI